MLPVNKRAVTIFLVTAIVILCFRHFHRPAVQESQIFCYSHKTTSLPSILNFNPAKNRSIFFHETSCNSDTSGKIVIKARQACAVESAARANPNFEIYLLYVSPGTFKFEGTESDAFLRALLAYENVRIHHLDFGEYLRGTTVENLWIWGSLERSNFVHAHASDVLRFVTLSKYGGIYLDLDVVVTKSLENVSLNYVAAESDSLIGSAVISFDSGLTGRRLSTLCLKDLSSNFDGTQWPHNGPGVVTRLAQSLCGTEDITRFSGTNCQGLTVFERKYFFPVSYPNWTSFFSKDSLGTVMEAIKDSYVVHMWNKLSGDTKIPVNDEVPYSILAKQYCPKVFKACKEFF